MAGGVLVLLGAAAWWAARGPSPDRPWPIPGDAPGTPVVEVLNATEVDGLAREITRRLRRRGIDVVSFGSATRRDLDSTVILVRRGDSTAATAVRDALGIGRIAVELDSRLLLDATILVGRDLAPAAGGNRDP